jgi:hypothetical protein
VAKKAEGARAERAVESLETLVADKVRACEPLRYREQSA